MRLQLSHRFKHCWQQSHKYGWVCLVHLERQIALFRFLLAEVRPCIHHGTSPFDCITSPVCCLRLVLNRMSKGLLGQLMREFRFFPNPVPKGRAEAVDGNVGSSETTKLHRHGHCRKWMPWLVAFKNKRPVLARRSRFSMVSFHCAPKTSFDLAAVRIQNSKARAPME